MSKIRGVFEKVPGSGVWWIQYFDRSGRRRREMAGTKSCATNLYAKRKLEALQGRKLPESLRARVVPFREIAEDARRYCEQNNRWHQFDGYRIDRLIAKFGNRAADLLAEDVRTWFEDQGWGPGTFNRYKSTLSRIYRLAIENEKVTHNLARKLKHKKEPRGRVRFLNQFLPLKQQADGRALADDLIVHANEESRLRAVLAHDFPSHLAEFDIALNTGMRPSEQFALTWDDVDLLRKQVALWDTKNGEARHIPLNAIACAAFAELFARSRGEGKVFSGARGEPLKGYKHWFDPAVARAGIKHFTWYCLRHTFASRLVMAGVDLRTVAELMGHKCIQMTMRYAHLAPAHNLAAVERLVPGTFPCATTSATSPTVPQKQGNVRVQ